MARNARCAETFHVFNVQIEQLRVVQEDGMPGGVALSLKTSICFPRQKPGLRFVANPIHNPAAPKHGEYLHQRGFTHAWYSDDQDT